MSRGVWFLAGTAVGVYGVSKARRAAEAFTVDGIHDRLSGLFVGARIFGAEVKHAAADKESELNDRIDAGRREFEPPGYDRLELGLENHRPIALTREGSN